MGQVVPLRAADHLKCRSLHGREQRPPFQETSLVPDETTTENMSKQQLQHLIVETASNFDRALNTAPQQFADRPRREQREVAESREQAQNNETLLRTRVS